MKFHEALEKRRETGTGPHPALELLARWGRAQHTPIEADRYVWEIPQLVQRAKQAATCLRCADAVFGDLDKGILLQVRQQHEFVLEYLEMLQLAAVSRYQHRIVDTQIALDSSVRRLTFATVCLAVLSVVVSIIALLK